LKRFCATRAIKNAKFIRSVAPHIIPAKEPPGGFASLVPIDILRRFHKMNEAELQAHPELVDAHRKLQELLQRTRPAGKATTRFGIVTGSSFQGTLHFAKIPFEDKAKGTLVVVSDADLNAAMQYMMLASQAVSAYCSLYGPNRIRVSPRILPHATVEVSNGSYNDDTLQSIVNGIVAQNNLPHDSSCIVVINPHGVVNTGASGAFGYHDQADAPYCFIDPVSFPLTIEDRANSYAGTLSHEVAEMVCDPDIALFHTEVCDGCDVNCNNDSWYNFFQSPSASLANSYLESAAVSTDAIPAKFKYTFYTTGVARPDQSDDCPASAPACAYPPPRPTAANELLFYDGASQVAEFHALDQQCNLNIQIQYTNFLPGLARILSGRFSTQNPGTTLLFYDAAHHQGEFHGTDGTGNMVREGPPHTDWRSSWAQIVKGHFAAGSFEDLLFYDASAGQGEFYRTGNGDVTRIGVTNTDWLTSWTLIVPGKFSNGPFTDLLFYNAGLGAGDFWRTDGEGNISRIGVSNNDWLKTWTMIIPGKFSNGPFTDLLFYDRAAGVGSFWRTDGEGNVSEIGTNTDWRKDWSLIIPGHFTGGQSTDLFFYEASTGTGEFRRIDAKGNDTLIRGYHDLRKNWTAIVSL